MKCGIVLLLLIGSTLGAKKCDEESLCSALRTHEPNTEEIFSAKLDSLSIKGNDAIIDLINSNGKVVHLQISALFDDRFRFQFLEEKNDRFKLIDVLEKEPETQTISYQLKTDNSVIIGVSESSIAKIQIDSNPLKITVLHNDIITSSILGSHLYFEESSFTVKVDFSNDATLVGLHEHGENLELQNTEPGGLDPYRLRNMDVPSYPLKATSSVYGAVPVLYACGVKATNGIFLHNAAQQWIEINKTEVSAYFMVDGGSLDLFTLPGPTLRDTVRQYVNLTGKAHLPQLWALGYHQSKYNYVDQEDVKQVIATFDLYDFPVDSIWLDIDYTDGKRYFTWDPNTFSDPVEMQNNLSTTNRKLVAIIDPHIKVDPNYKVYAGALERGLLAKNPDNSTFEGDCWPGKSSYWDFLDPDAREYYADQYSYDNFPHTTETLAGIWNDMNEPVVFDGGLNENSMPPDTVHFGGVPHKALHNAYGMLQTKSTHLGLLKRDNYKKRPFILSRSTFAGSQRFTAFWTGDNAAAFEYLAITVPMCLNANLLGLVFCGSDVGGFNRIPTDELFARWYQIGAWIPFFRQHSGNDTPRREPYLYSDDIQKIVREAIKLRYAHLPVWYTLFYEHTRNGDPVIRPLFYQYPEDANTQGINNQLLLGEDILIRAITESNATNAEVYFPGSSSWFQLNNKQFFNGSSKSVVDVDSSFIPVYYRSGSIIARKDTPRPSTTEQKDDPFTLYVNLGPNDQNATGKIYVDDLISFDYADNNNYIYASLIWDGSSVNVKRIDGNGSDGDFPIKIEQIVVNQVNDSNVNDGEYEQKIFRKTVDGQLLSEVHINTKQGHKLKIME